MLGMNRMQWVAAVTSVTRGMFGGGKAGASAPLKKPRTAPTHRKPMEWFLFFPGDSAATNLFHALTKSEARAACKKLYGRIPPGARFMTHEQIVAELDRVKAKLGKFNKQSA